MHFTQLMNKFWPIWIIKNTIVRVNFSFYFFFVSNCTPISELFLMKEMYLFCWYLKNSMAYVGWVSCQSRQWVAILLFSPWSISNFLLKEIIFLQSSLYSRVYITRTLTKTSLQRMIPGPSGQWFQLKQIKHQVCCLICRYDVVSYQLPLFTFDSYISKTQMFINNSYICYWHRLWQ